MNNYFHAFFFTILFCFLSPHTKASFLIDWQLGYGAHGETKTDLGFQDLTNHFFLGAALGKKEQLYFGQNITSQSKTYDSSSQTDISTLELGPRLHWFFNEEKTLLLILAWNPYAKGSRISAGGTATDVSGSSLLVGLGYELKISKMFYLGASINYHSLSISKSEVNNVSTEESSKYTSITPMLNFSLRFR